MRDLFRQILHFFEPLSAKGDPDRSRRSRLLIGFGVLGSVFGLSYAAFYLAIDHIWGAFVVVVCSGVFALIPWLVRRGRSAAGLAELYAAILLCGFSALCWLEGGLHGHAVAWLVSVPLCALLLIGQRAAARWGILCFLMTGLFALLEIAGVSPESAYPVKWENLVSSAGYLGLVVFMLILGIIFERGRHDAAQKMAKANDELSEANERLILLNREKNEFLSIAAHDLKNPLTVVRGMSDLIAEGMLPPARVAGAADKISQQAIRMHDLIANLLDLNAIEEGRMNLNPVPNDLVELVDQVIDNFAEIAARKQIRLIREIEVGTAPVCVDSRAVMQVLDNLLSNAIKYSPPDLPLEVELKIQENTVKVAVADHGPGISEEDQRKLFQRFTRLTARPTAGESSNGLGLSIVKRLVDAMGGDIRCASRLGQGTKFELSLPLHHAEPSDDNLRRVEMAAAGPPGGDSIALRPLRLADA